MKHERPTSFSTGWDVRYCPDSGNILKISFLVFFQQQY